MRYAAAAVAVAALAAGTLLPAAAAGAREPLTVKETYADKFYREPGVGWDTVAVAKVKATFLVEFDPAFVGNETEGTVLAFTLGDLEFASTLGEADRYVPGKSAKWTVLDDFTEKPAVRVKATFRKGVLKVVVNAKNEDGAFTAVFTGEEDLPIEGEVLEADLAFGGALYTFEGTFSGKADTKVKVKAGDEYDVSKVSIAGTATASGPPEDLEDPEADILSPLPEEVVATASTSVSWEASDDTSLSTMEYRVNGGAWTALEVPVVVDPDFGTVFAEGAFLVDTSTPGSYTVEIHVVDAVGNEATATVTFTVTLD